MKDPILEAAMAVVKQPLDEGPRILDVISLSLIKKMLGRGDYTGALVQAAKMLGYKDMEQKLSKLWSVHRQKGTLPSNLAHERDMIYMDLLKQAKRDLSSQDYNALSRAF